MATRKRNHTPLILGIFAVLAAIFIIGTYASAHNSGNAHEQGIKGAYENNQQILARFGNEVQEIAQVPAMATEDLVKVLTAGNESRYGAEGSQASWQMLQENYPGKLDSALYTRLQDVISSGRRDFEQGQKQLIDRKVAYETELGSFWKGSWMRFAGYPKIDLSEYKTVTSARSTEAFRTGQEEAIKLR